MRILRNELYKVLFQKTFWLILILLICANGILLYSHKPDKLVDAKTYQEVYRFIERMSEEEKTDYIYEYYLALEDIVNPTNDNIKRPGEKVKLQFSNDIIIEWQLFNELNNQIQEITTYSGYLQSIQDKAVLSSGISIFNQQNTFAIRNEKKTAEDFQKITVKQLYFTKVHAFLEATDFIVTDILLIVLLLYVVSILVSQEKENGMLAMVKPLSKGRDTLLTIKMSTFFLIACAAAFLFWGENYLIAGCKYGFNNLNIPLQSISEYIGSSLQVTVGEYLLIFVLTKIFVYTLICLLFMFFTLLANYIVTSYVCAVLVFGISFVVYQIADGNSGLQLLKYINIVHWLQVNGIYKQYFNLNICTYPVNMIPVCLLSLLSFMIIAICANLAIYSKTDSAVRSQNRFFRERNWNDPFRLGLYFQEGYKLMIMQRGIIVLLLLIGVQIYFYPRNIPYVSANERYYQSYMEQLEGRVTKEKMEIVVKEKTRLESYDKMLSDALKQYQRKEISDTEFNAIERLVNENCRGREAFERVMERIYYLDEYTETTQKAPYFVYETGYEKLTGHSENGYQDDLIQATFVLVSSIAIFSGFFAMEFSSGMITIISSCRNGYGITIRKKLIFALVVSTFIYFISYLPFVIIVVQTYGLNCLNVDAACIPSLSGSWSGIRLWQCLFLLFTERYIVHLCMLLLVFALSVYFKDGMKTMLAASVLLVMPMGIHLLDIHVVDYISMNVFLSGNMLFNQLNTGGLLIGLIPLVIGAMSCRYLMRSFKASH